MAVPVGLALLPQPEVLLLERGGEGGDALFELGAIGLAHQDGRPGRAVGRDAAVAQRLGGLALLVRLRRGGSESGRAEYSKRQHGEHADTASDSPHGRAA